MPTGRIQSDEMKRLDGYLSRKAQAVFPDSLVYCDEAGPVQVWTMERPGKDPLGLGGSFRAAHGAVVALVKAEKAKGSEPEKPEDRPYRKVICKSCGRPEGSYSYCTVCYIKHD